MPVKASWVFAVSARDDHARQPAASRSSRFVSLSKSELTEALGQAYSLDGQIAGGPGYWCLPPDPHRTVDFSNAYGAPK
jgi:hypothetical protein